MTRFVVAVYQTSDRAACAVGRPVAVAWRKVTGTDPRHLAVGLVIAGAVLGMRMAVVANQDPRDAAWQVAVQLVWLAGLPGLIRAHDRDNDGGQRRISRTGFTLRVITLLFCICSAGDLVIQAVHGDRVSLLIVGSYDLASTVGLLVLLAGDPGGRSVWQERAERRALRLVAA